MTSEAIDSETAPESPNPTRSRRFERPPGAALAIIIIGVVLVITAVILAIVPGTIRKHQTVDQLTNAQAKYVTQQLAAGRSFAAVSQAVAGTQFTGGPTITTDLQQVSAKQFTLTVKSTDGYTRKYVSSTQTYTSDCSAVTCWLGINS